jgi:hypothetical protein
MRHDFLTVAPPAELVAQLELLRSHRTGLIEDWVRTVNRLRRLLLGISPALERALTVTNVATLILLTGYQTPDQIRAAGRDELVAHLRRHHALHVAKVADTAVAAAQQRIICPGRTSQPASLPNSPPTSWIYAGASTNSTRPSPPCSTSTHKQRSS